MEGERHFYLYLLRLSTILYVLSFIFELYQNENPLCKHDNNSRDMHSPKIKYIKAELLNLKPKVYITKMDMDTCNHIKNFKMRQNFRRKREEKICSRIWGNNNGVHHNLLRPLNRSDKIF